MLSPSITLAVLVVAAGVVAVAVLVWAFLRGFLDDDAIRKQSTEILERDDLRCVRPWETPAQRAERVALYGPPVEPRPGEFGGSR